METRMSDAETQAKKYKTTYINIPEAVGVFDTFEAQGFIIRTSAF